MIMGGKNIAQPQHQGDPKGKSTSREDSCHRPCCWNSLLLFPLASFSSLLLIVFQPLTLGPHHPNKASSQE